MINAANADVQFQRIDTSSAPETNFPGRFYGKYTKITNAGKIMITQAIESRDCQHLRTKTIRLQIWLKATTATQTYRLGLIQLTSAGTVDTVPAATAGSWISAAGAAGTDPTLTAGNNTAYVAPTGTDLDNCTANGNAVDCTVTTAWQRFGATWVVPSDCKNILFALWSNDNVAVNDGVSLAQASMTLGTDIVAFTALAEPLELLRCQRFILKSFDVDTQPAQNAGGGNTIRWIVGKSNSANGVFMYWRFPTPLFRDSLDNTNPFPSIGITTYNPSAANANGRNVTAALDLVLAAPISSRTQVQFQMTTTNVSAVGDLVEIHALIYGEL